MESPVCKSNITKGVKVFNGLKRYILLYVSINFIQEKAWADLVAIPNNAIVFAYAMYSFSWVTMTRLFT